MVSFFLGGLMLAFFPVAGGLQAELLAYVEAHEPDNTCGPFGTTHQPHLCSDGPESCDSVIPAQVCQANFANGFARLKTARSNTTFEGCKYKWRAEWVCDYMGYPGDPRLMPYKSTCGPMGPDYRVGLYNGTHFAKKMRVHHKVCPERYAILHATEGTSDQVDGCSFAIVAHCRCDAEFKVYPECTQHVRDARCPYPVLPAKPRVTCIACAAWWRPNQEASYTHTCNALKDAGKPGCLNGVALWMRGLDVARDSVSVAHISMTAARRSYIDKNMSDPSITKTIELAGVRYTVPRDVNVNPINSLISETEDRTYKDREAFARAAAAELGIKAEGVGSFDLKFDDSVSKALRDNQQVVLHKFQVPKYSIVREGMDQFLLRKFCNFAVGTLLTVWGSCFTNRIITRSKRLVSNFGTTAGLFTESNAKVLASEFAAAWVNEHGTHSIARITMGGELILQFTFDDCVSEQERRTFINANLCVTNPAASGCIGGSYSPNSSQDTLGKSATCTLYVNGGDLKHCASGSSCDSPCNVAKWQASVDTKTATAIDMKLFSVVELMDELAKDPRLVHFFGMDHYAAAFEAELKKSYSAGAAAASTLAGKKTVAGSKTDNKDCGGKIGTTKKLDVLAPAGVSVDDVNETLTATSVDAPWKAVFLFALLCPQ